MSTLAGIADPIPQISSRGRVTARTLAAVATVGVLVSALTWRASPGLGWLAVDVLLVGALAAGSRARPTAAACGLAFASIWLAGATCWYASDWALATALPGSVALLGAFALAVAGRVGLRDLDAVGRVGLDAVRGLPTSVVDTARLPAGAFDADARAGARAIGRGALVGVPLAGVFALLLSADPEFRRAVAGLALRSGAGASFALWTGLTLAGVFVARRVLERATDQSEAPSAPPRPEPWPYRVAGDGDPPAATSPALPPLTWGVALLHVVAVFAIYVVAGARSLFAGHAVLRAHGTVTYAAYVHAGFIQVSLATLLAVGCVVAGQALLRPRFGAPGGTWPMAGGGVAGKRALVGIELALLALVGVTLASCAHRLALYEEAYGYTQLRLGVWWLQLGIAGLVTLTAARSVARTWRGWTAGLAWSGVVFVTLAGSVDADAWIARRNVARARAGAPLDTTYLASLSEDAADALGAVASLGPAASEDLQLLDAAWSDAAAREGDDGWRSRRGVGAWLAHALERFPFPGSR